MQQKTRKKDLFTSLHMIKENVLHWAEFEILQNGALFCIGLDQSDTSGYNTSCAGLVAMYLLHRF